MSIFHRRKQGPELEDYEWSEADKALAQTRLEAARAMSEWPTVEKVSAALTEQLEKNNFADRIRSAFGGDVP